MRLKKIIVKNGEEAGRQYQVMEEIILFFFINDFNISNFDISSQTLVKFQ